MTGALARALVMWRSQRSRHRRFFAAQLITSSLNCRRSASRPQRLWPTAPAHSVQPGCASRPGRKGGFARHVRYADPDPERRRLNPVAEHAPKSLPHVLAVRVWLYIYNLPPRGRFASDIQRWRNLTSCWARRIHRWAFWRHQAA